MRILILLLISTLVEAGCKESSTSNFVTSQNTAERKLNTSSIDDKETEFKCDFIDGTHYADVDYYNPKTKHAAKYNLKVHVKDCNIIQIDFPNGGWLDEDHITKTQINKNKEALLKDDKGRQWKIHLN